ncbi:MAG TPA: hypothetical protein VK155_16465 [Bacteroidales bacterium]|nr:hypothetical protein [Bacteroidales bacterium]
MKLIPVIVRTHSGYKADERPTSIVQENKEFIVEDVTDRWYQGDLNPEFPPADYFRVKTSDTMELIIKHDLRSDSWYLCIQD